MSDPTASDPWKSSSVIKLICIATPLGLFLASRLSSFMTPLVNVQSLEISFQVAYCAVLAAEAALFALFLYFENRFAALIRKGRWLALACGIIGLAGSLLILLSGTAPIGANYALLVVGIALSALYAATIFVMMIFHLERMALSDAALTLALTGAIFAIINLIYLQIQDRSGIIMILLATPLLIGLGVQLLPFEFGERDENAPMPRSFKVFLNPKNNAFGTHYITAVFFCAVGAAYTRLLSSPGTNAVPYTERSLTLYLSLLLCISLFVILRNVALSDRLLSALFNFFSTMFIMALMLTVVMAFQGMTAYGTALIKASQRLLEIFALIMTTYAVKEKQQSVVFAASLYGICVLVIPHLIAHGIAVPANEHIGFNSSNHLIPATAVIALVAVSLTFGIVTINSLRSEKVEKVDYQEYASHLCEMAARDKGLTPRELEIMKYVYKGFSVKKIAEISFIAATTVQGHTRNIYRKLGVHSKQELIDLVDSYAEESKLIIKRD